MNRICWSLPALVLAGGLLLMGWQSALESSAASSHLTTLRYVAADGDCGSNTPCYSTLQAAVDAATDGDELRVAAGLYTGVSDRHGTTQLVYVDKSITIRGGYHPQTWAPDPTLNPTILDAQGLGRVLSITGAVSPVVDGFHLINGSGGNGGGVYVETAAASLSHNEIYGNWAEGMGGGVYLKDSAATIANNHIYTNTTGPTGRGGGLGIIDSPATLDDNVIEDNRAHVGGGVEMNNTLGTGGARMTGNVIRNNVAFDLQQDGYTFDGAGGGLDVGSYLTDTLRNNTISGNTARWGGGVHAYGATAVIADNTIQENDAPTHGGGLYVQGGRITLEHNDILSNTASNWGGGLTLQVNDATVRRNTFRGNTAGWRGGGMYTGNTASFDGNLFLGNSATEQGGGAFLIQGSGSVYWNNVFVDNQAAEGGGLYIWASDVSLIHNTIANNASGDGRAVVIDKYPGLVNPSEPTLYTATVVFSNTIVAGQTVGFFATADNSLTVDGVLWWDTPTHVQADGVDLTLRGEHTGDPAFQADGYHLRMVSAARDKARSSLDHDVDGQLRDPGDLKDLGADEHVPTVVIDPESGGNLTYVHAQESVTITISVPPGAVSEALALMFSPFPPLPPDVMNSPFGQFIAIGPPFGLIPFHLDPSVPVTNTLDPPLADPYEDALIFEHYPAEVIAEVGLEKLRIMHRAMEQAELALLALLDAPSPPQNPACGPVQVDEEQRTIDVPICDTGIISGTTVSAGGPPLQLMQVQPETGTGYFVFVFEVEETRVYLPLLLR
jgi:hypothetical protein